MKKKVLSVLLSVAMMSALLVGCGNSSSNPAPADDAAASDDAAAASGEVEELTWMFWDALNAGRVLHEVERIGCF